MAVASLSVLPVMKCGTQRVVLCSVPAGTGLPSHLTFSCFFLQAFYKAFLSPLYHDSDSGGSLFLFLSFNLRCTCVSISVWL